MPAGGYNSTFSENDDWSTETVCAVWLLEPEAEADKKPKVAGSADVEIL